MKNSLIMIASCDTYKALSELGRAVKTIFFARYLHSLGLCRESGSGAMAMSKLSS